MRKQQRSCTVVLGIELELYKVAYIGADGVRGESQPRLTHRYQMYSSKDNGKPNEILYNQHCAVNGKSRKDWKADLLELKYVHFSRLEMSFVSNEMNAWCCY